MTMDGLEKQLKEMSVPQDIYSILKGGLPNEQLCIAKDGSQWEVYDSERGRKSGFKIFNDEETACEYFLDKLKKYATDSFAARLFWRSDSRPVLGRQSVLILFLFI